MTSPHTFTRRDMLAASAALFAASGAESSSAASDGEGRHAFDFFFGKWNVAHERLTARLQGSSEWERFTGFSEAQPLLGGLGNIDDNLINLPSGSYRAVTLRAFDPTAKQWSIWWLDARNPVLEPPVYGAFERGVGVFYGDAVLRGQPIKVRFNWSEITPTAARWDQAFSPDGGATWETNWIMRFSRSS